MYGIHFVWVLERISVQESSEWAKKSGPADSCTTGFAFMRVNRVGKADQSWFEAQAFWDAVQIQMPDAGGRCTDAARPTRNPTVSLLAAEQGLSRQRANLKVSHEAGLRVHLQTFAQHISQLESFANESMSWATILWKQIFLWGLANIKCTALIQFIA